ncbi:MAG: PTS sugar transporter subunit IIA [Chloroflexi bacterium]|nr:PTS sugar transporter subunit IIA [Chloroflexota bacterium]
MLAQLLDSHAIILNYPAKDAEDVIRHLSQKLLESGYVKDSFAQAALSREATLPTGLPLGGEINAAIPHTDVEHVIKPAVALATLPKPVIFRNMVEPEEEVPVRLVFLLALEEPKSQVAMLQEVAGILQNPQLIQRLTSATTVAEVQTILAENEAS